MYSEMAGASTQNGHMASPSHARANGWAKVAALWDSPEPAQQVRSMMSPATLQPLEASSVVQDEIEDDQIQALDAIGDRYRVKLPAPAAVSHPMPQDISLEPRAAVLRIQGEVHGSFIQHVTARIHEGPLQEIRIESMHAARVTFLHASHALKFLHAHEEMVKICGYGRLGRGYNLELVEILDWNEDHLRMNQPIRERRRLSFARKELFTGKWTSEMWKQDLRNIAGASNIDFVWVFNSGNGEY